MVGRRNLPKWKLASSFFCSLLQIRCCLYIITCLSLIKIIFTLMWKAAVYAPYVILYLTYIVYDCDIYFYARATYWHQSHAAADKRTCFITPTEVSNKITVGSHCEYKTEMQFGFISWCGPSFHVIHQRTFLSMLGSLYQVWKIKVCGLCINPRRR
jgi:hypothetical protein